LLELVRQAQPVQLELGLVLEQLPAVAVVALLQVQLELLREQAQLELARASPSLDQLQEP